jgi:glycosyltransferase involved in cell wall biosynthesis
VWAPAPAPLAVSRDVPFVLTVHDLSWLERPQDFTAYERLWHRAGRFARLAERADRIVLVAAANTEALQRHWRVADEKIRIIAPGIPHRPVGALPPGVPERFFLSVGALEPRKDPELLVRAHARAGVDTELVFAGSGRLATRLRGPGVTVVEGATDAQLGALYTNATALVSASRLEGFGFPPLEAAALGTPSVLNDLPVFHETLGDGATYVPVSDEDAWVEALRAAAESPRPAPDVSGFSWARAARELRDVLAEVAG